MDKSVEIKVKNIGPIVEFEYAFKNFGLHVVKGPNGSGKSTLERTIEFATTGVRSQQLQKRDGTPRGEASIAGAVIRVTKQVRVEGELEVEGLGDLNLSKLCDPGIKDQALADAERIRTLNRLAGTKADAKLFYDIFGGKEQFDKLASPLTMNTSDLVEMAMRAKADLETAARAVEKDLEKEESLALAQQRLADEEKDLNVEHDEIRLQDALEVAIRNESEMRERRRVYRATIKAAEDAREKLAKLPPGKSVDEAKVEVESAKSRVEFAQAADTAALEKIRRLEDELRAAKLERNTTEQAITAAKDSLTAAQGALQAAENDVELRGQLDAAIAASAGAQEVTADQVDDAIEATGRARDAQSKGFKIRQAIAARSLAEQHRTAAKGLAIEARRLRDAAKDTMSVLTTSVTSIPNCPLRVKGDDNGNPRLVVTTDRSDDEKFCELSDGERWRVAIGIAAKSRRLIPLAQSAYEGLADSLKAQIDQLAKENECYILGSQAVDCVLHAEPFEMPSNKAAE